MLKISIESNTIIETRQYAMDKDATPFWSVAYWTNHYYWEVESADETYYYVKIYHDEYKPEYGYTQYRIYRHQNTITEKIVP